MKKIIVNLATRIDSSILFKTFIVAAMVLLTGSCATPINKVFQNKKIISSGITSDLIKKDNFKLVYDGLPGGIKLGIRYLGCGGFHLSLDDRSIFIDPYFSHYPLLHLPFKKIKTRPADVKYGLSNIENLDQTSSVLISHSHYDHLLDTPFILENYLNNGTEVYGSESTYNIIQSVINSDHISNISERVVAYGDQATANNWIHIGENIRILAIVSEHAPHARFIFPIRFHTGSAKSIKQYDEPAGKTKARSWKGGETYSFLIDRLDGDQVAFRIFIQSTAAKPFKGFPPRDILVEKQVDLAILGGASFQYIRGQPYPWNLIEYIEPERILVCHWEDFFRPYQEKPKRFIRMTNFKRFLLELNEHYPLDKKKDRYFLLEPQGKVSIAGD